MSAIRARLTAMTGGAPAQPLVLLSALYFFDEFDTSAFGVLAPNIKKSFHLSDQGFATVVVLNLSIVLLLGIPAGYLGDRVPRRALAVICGVAAGVFSLLTGIVGTLFLLVVVRVGNGIGNLSNTTVQQSLLADYYSPKVRPAVFSLYLSSPGLGAIIGGVVAGTLAGALGWRPSFYLFIAPIVIVALLCIRLPEPLRGQADDAEAAKDVAGEAPPRFGEAARTLWAVTTLRRQFVAYSFIGAGLVPLAFTIPLFYERVYHLGEFGRGVLTSVDSAALLVGTIVVGPFAKRWLARDVGEPLKWAGGIVALVGLLLLGMALSPFEVGSLVCSVLAFFVAGAYVPPFASVQALVSPARVRTTAFAFGSLFLVAGVVLLYLLLPVSSVGDKHGLRAGLAALVPYWLIGGAILASSSRFVAGDAAAALRSLAALSALRARREAVGASGPGPALLTCAGVDVAYDGVQVLFGVDFEVTAGEIVALLGTNGAGKSTLLKAISGLQPPVAGSILFDGQDITYADAKERFHAGIVQMPGGRSVFPTLTVAECLRLAEWTGKRDAAATAEVLALFPVLASRAAALAGNLSGGEQQMLGLAMAFLARPKLLMIDELSLGLAPAIVGQLVETVRAIHAQGTTVVVVEQSVNLALTLAERAVFMEKGEVRFTGPTQELLGRDDILRAVFLEGAAADHRAAPAADRPAAPVTAQPRPRPTPVAQAQPLRQPVGDREPVLELVDIAVRFGGVRAVDGVSLTLPPDHVLGIIGANGAGKTTLFDAISGFVPTAGGFVVLGGTDVTGWGADRRARAGLGRSFQDARIFPSLTVVENLAVALERHLEVRDPLACALGLPAVVESEAKAALRVHELVELLGLGAFRNKFVGELSTGTRRMVDLGMALGHRPSVLLLDEPSSGIAQRETEALGPVLKRIQREVGCSLLVIEHDMPLITGLADTLMALETGRVIATGAPTEVIADPRVVASYLGDNEAAILRSGGAA